MGKRLQQKILNVQKAYENVLYITCHQRNTKYNQNGKNWKRHKYHIFARMQGNSFSNTADGSIIETNYTTTLQNYLLGSITANVDITFSFLFSHSVMSDSSSPWTAAHQASLSFTISWSLLKPKSIEAVMPSNHLILCHPFFSCLQSFPASGSFPMSQLFISGGQSIGASALASVLPMNIQGLFLRTDWFGFLAI